MKIPVSQKEVWNKIAGSWKKFRVNSLNEVLTFLKYKKGKILDLGCGSGRNFTKVEGIIYGVDFSKNMLRFAKEYAKKKRFNVKLIKSEAFNLPFEDNSFDAAIFTSVLHCIPENEKREKALRELFRVLKPKAEAFISVWNKNQRKFKGNAKEVLIPWKYNKKEFFRYYYLYEEKEILNLLKRVGFDIIKTNNSKNAKRPKLKKNIQIIVKKLK